MTMPAHDMNASAEVTEGFHPRLSLDGSLGIRQAKEIYERLCQALSAADTVEIDLGGLTSLDVSIVQLLLSARNSAMRKDKQFTLSGRPSEPVGDLLAAYGLVGPGNVARTPDEEFWLGSYPSEARAA